jgi:general secretion pathway protein C
LASAITWIDELRSVQGLTRLFADRGAQVVVLVLVLALGVDAAWIVTRALSHGPTLPPPAAPAALARPSVNPTLQLATIVNAHLFGASATATGSDAPTTSMPLILAGVIADRDPGKGVAIIGENAAAGKLYSVGAAIPGGAHLHAVYSDRVLLERNGGLETLMLPRATSGARGAALGAAAPAPRAAASRDNSSVLAGLVRIQPVFNQGKLSGYRIFPGGAHGTSAFNQLGLKPGDMIEAVNGTALDDAARAMEVLQTLSSSATATVTVSRNGQTQEVNLNLANLNIEADSGDNAAAAPPAADQGAGAGGSPYRGHAMNPNLSTAPGAAPGAGGNINGAASSGGGPVGGPPGGAQPGPDATSGTSSSSGGGERDR